jgi:RHS repeat-associated protein
MSVYYLADGLGSTMATTDASGNIVNTYTYDPYGATTSSTGSQPNAFQFAGQATDPTGLQYLRARYYDPATGAFLSSDPMGVSPSWPGKPYAYADANPVLNTDPYGLWGIPSIVKKAAGAVADAVVTATEAAAPVVEGCAIWGAEGALVGSVTGGGALAGLLRSGLDCGIWSAAAGIGEINVWNIAAACGSGIASSVLPDSQGWQCAAGAILGLSSNAVQAFSNLSAGCAAGATEAALDASFKGHSRFVGEKTP